MTRRTPFTALLTAVVVVTGAGTSETTASSATTGTSETTGTGPDVGESACDLPLADSAELPIDRGDMDAMRSTLDAYVDNGDIAGYTTVATYRGSLIEHTMRGHRDTESDLRIDDDTLFRLASLTKPIVSAMALTLVEDGTLGLDDPVSRYLLAYGNLEVLDADGRRPLDRPMTIRDLLTHTSGLGAPERSSGGHAEAFREVSPYEASHLGDLVDRLARAPLFHQPGEGWTYGLGTDVLGRVPKWRQEHPSRTSLPNE